MATAAPPASGAPNTLDAEALWYRLRGCVPNLVVLPEVDSTHAMAVRLVSSFSRDEEAELDDTVILTHSQTAGQGRDGRLWQSPPGGLYLTWLRSGIAAELLPLLPVCTAVAGLDALAATGIDTAVIKWPNDLLIDAHKVGGCLAHARSGPRSWGVVSLGLNLTAVPPVPGAPAHPPTSVQAQLEPSGSPLDLLAVVPNAVHGFVSGLERALTAPPAALQRWRDRLIHNQGDAMTVRRADGSVITGLFRGTTEHGLLRLEHNGRELEVAAGDVVDTEATG
jgi:BirA family biotin operon repressor/biotin-[acetyl-CoA-carboxylase] ligase